MTTKQTSMFGMTEVEQTLQKELDRWDLPAKGVTVEAVIRQMQKGKGSPVFMALDVLRSVLKNLPKDMATEKVEPLVQALNALWNNCPQKSLGGQSPAQIADRDKEHRRDLRKKLREIVLQLHVSILHTRPPIWRRLLIPADTHFSDLHAVIQSNFGWRNIHLHSFEIARPHGRRTIIDTEGFDNPFAMLTLGSTEYRNEKDTMIGEFLLSKGARCLYWYDFCHDWKHRIRTEKVLPRDSDQVYLCCIGGRRGVPEED